MKEINLNSIKMNLSFSLLIVALLFDSRCLFLMLLHQINSFYLIHVKKYYAKKVMGLNEFKLSMLKSFSYSNWILTTSKSYYWKLSSILEIILLMNAERWLIYLTHLWGNLILRFQIKNSNWHYMKNSLKFKS